MGEKRNIVLLFRMAVYTAVGELGGGGGGEREREREREREKRRATEHRL